MTLQFELADIAAELGTDELRALVCIARRLRRGQELYGKLDAAADTRDWKRETAEEMLDSCVYLAAQLLRFGAND